jgi:CHASE2 domain-containing sensor protein/predicted Ser/Thr protein kinase
LNGRLDEGQAVSTSSSAKRSQFWRADWFVAVAVIVAVLILSYSTDTINTLERRFYDFGSTSSSRQPSNRIAVIAIDDQSIANIGRWPWSREVHAEMIGKLAAAKAKTIAYNVFFSEPQTDRSITFIRKLKEALGPVPEGQGGVAGELSKIISEAEKALDTDAQLAASIKKAGNVLLPSLYDLGEPQGKPDKPLPAFVAKSGMRETNGFSVATLRGQFPLESLGAAAAGVGHLNQERDSDGAVRSDPLLVNYYGTAIPSMALLAAASSLNLAPTDIKLNTGESVQIGKLRIRTDDQARMNPQFYAPRDNKSPIPVDSFYDVLSGKIPASKYADKIVLVGPTAGGLGQSFAAPGYAGMTPVEFMAHVTSSILGEHFITQPQWTTFVALGVLLLIAAYLIGLLPRLSAGLGAIVTTVLFVTLLVTEFFLLSGSALWMKFMLPASVLVIGHLALTTKRFLVTEAGKSKSDEESAETNRMMGLALQGQGQLDAAFDRFRRVPHTDALMDNLNALALDFERKRQFNKVQSVYEYMFGLDKKYKGLEDKLKRAKNLSETVILGGGGAHPGGTMLLDGGGVEKPMLGRYQVEKELGKGAMGVVYLGKDPKIGRVVAIKTMALSQEFEGDELTDARERFFREAETAGRLQHQNIVTIFDAGEEHDLAYIAMEFLKGKDLVDQCKDGQLLEMPRVISIVARVAEALAYAHRQNVVHRDIKPANIMYELESDTVKVTDFGIARITDSSKTKTGLVLGTPSFMSPEQIAGKKVDGRSDLYSLGVMLFQMLTGVLPFRGDSMAELMYKIANEEAPDIRIVRKDISEKLANVVALALSKRPETRYQDGDQFAGDLRSAQAEMMGMSTSAVKALSKGVVLRPDDEVNARPARPTAPPVAAVAAAGAATAPVDDPDKTVIMGAAAPAPAAAPATDFEATVVNAPVPMAKPPGYDAGQTTGGGDQDAFIKTDIFQRPPERGPDSGGGNGN